MTAMVIEPPQLLRWTAPEGSSLERCVRRLPDCFLFVRMNTRRLILTTRSLVEVDEALLSGAAAIESDDPLLMRTLLFGDCTLNKTWCEIRDHRWGVAGSVALSPRLLDQDSAEGLVQLASRLSGASTTYIRNTLLTCLQGGMTPNALIPFYDRCGKPSPRRDAKRRGRRAGHGHPCIQSKDDPLVAKMNRGYFKYFVSRRVRSLAAVWRKTKAEFFDPEPELMPTYRQFYYWCHVLRDKAKVDPKLRGQDYVGQERPILGTVDELIDRPGMVFVDATPLDLHSLCGFDWAKPLGRLTLYMAVDVFSRLIVAFALTSENAGSLAAMLLMENMVTDKVTVAAQYALKIAPEDWPWHFLPEALYADRGELRGAYGDQLVRTHGIRVLNAAPYRPDWKSIVERMFLQVKDLLVDGLPGAVVPRQRGERDYRLDAALVPDEVIQLLIRFITAHNRTAVVEKTFFDEELLTSDVEPIPVALFQWGLARQGTLRTVAPTLARIAFLPQGTAYVEREGIRFKRVHYRPAGLDREGLSAWFINHVGTDLRVAYDPGSVSVLYLVSEERGFEACELATRDSGVAGWSWAEVDEVAAKRDERAKEASDRREQALVDLQKHITRTTEIAQVRKRLYGPRNRQAAVQGARRNRMVQRDAERRARAHGLRPQEPVNAPAPTPVSDPVNEEARRRRLRILRDVDE